MKKEQVSSFYIDKLDFLNIKNLLKEGIEEYILNLNHNYNYKFVYAFCIKLFVFDYKIEIVFIVATERDLDNIKDIVVNYNSLEFYKEIWKPAYWLLDEISPLFIPVFLQKWQLLNSKLWAKFTSSYGNCEEYLVNIEKILIEFFAKSLASLYKEGLFDNLKKTKCLSLFVSNKIKEALDPKLVTEKGKLKHFENAKIHIDFSTLQKERTNSNIFLLNYEVIALPRHPKLELAICNDIKNFEKWLIYADWLILQGDDRGEIIKLSIDYQKQIQNFECRKFDILLKQKSTWPLAIFDLLDKLSNLLTQKWNWLEPELSKLYFERQQYSLHSDIKWCYGFIYSIFFDENYIKKDLLFKLLSSPASFFVYSLSLWFKKQSSLEEILGEKKYISVRKLYLINYEDDSYIDLNKVLEVFPSLNFLYFGSRSKNEEIYSTLLQYLAINILDFTTRIYLPNLKTLHLFGNLYEEGLNVIKKTDNKKLMLVNYFTEKTIPLVKELFLEIDVSDDLISTIDIFRILSALDIVKQIEIVRFIEIKIDNNEKEIQEYIMLLSQWINLKQIQFHEHTKSMPEVNLLYQMLKEAFINKLEIIFTEDFKADY